MTFSKRLIFFLLALALLTTCTPAASPEAGDQPWRHGDLRALEAPKAADPRYDLIAAYTRLTATDLELRLDLLGSPNPFDYDLYVAFQSGTQTGADSAVPFPLDTQPTLAWDLALGLPARGLPRAFRADGSPAPLRPRITRLSVQDAAVVRLSLSEIRKMTEGEPGTGSDPRQFVFQVFLTRPGERQVIDSLGPLRVYGPAPSAQARVLLAFWNTLPATTPAQALRRWDGAHTGPYGQRHGLEVLLNAAQRTQIPVALLDLKQPDSLAALEALGGLPQVQQMIKEGLVLLPDAAYGDAHAAEISLGFSRQAGQRYGFADSPFLYGALTRPLPSGTRLAFAHLTGATGSLAWENWRLIPMPGGLDLPIDQEEVDQEGLTLPVRQQLLQAALSNQPGSLVTLGGDLPRSPWGDSLIIPPALEWIAGHPWLYAINGADLLKMPVQKGTSTQADGTGTPRTNGLPGRPDCPDLLCITLAKETPRSAEAEQMQTKIRATIQAAPAGLFTDLAWQAYLRLTGPAEGERLQRLRAGQLGDVIGPLVAAAQWNAAVQSAAPATQAACDRDLNWDGAPECILASPTTFLVLDPRGGRLVYAAARVNGKPLQIITTRAQYALGLGDPLEIQPERGPAGDPQSIPGAFAPMLEPYNAENWGAYTVDSQPGQVTFTHPGTGLRKTYRLSENGIQVSVEVPPGSTALAETRIPVALVDTGEAQAGVYSRYQIEDNSQPGTWIWRLSGGPQVQVRAQGAGLEGHAFSESHALLLKPEDPNLSYPPGHFIPFPLAIVTVKPGGNYSIVITVQ